MKRHRICIVLGAHWAQQMGGAQFQSKCIIDALIEDGNWDIHFLASLINPDFSPLGYTIHRIGKVHNRLRRFGGFIWDARSLTCQLNDLKPDIIYQRGLQAHTGVIGRFAAKSRVPFVYHISHDDQVVSASTSQLLRRSINKYIDRRAGEFGLRRADAVIAQTQFQASKLKETYGIDAALIAPNFHPLPTQEKEKPPGVIQVLWVANFKKSKRPTIFVELAESLIDNPQLRFVMIGRSGSRLLYSHLHRRITELPNLAYLGELPISEVNDEFERSHLFVNTSLAEGFPNTFIQAWMRNVAVLSMSVDPDQVLADCRIGRVCHSLDMLRAELLRLASDERSRLEMTDRAYAWAIQNHSPAASRRIIDLLCSLVTRGSSN